MLQKNILAFINFFYPLFKRVMPLQTYYYAVCGGFNVVFEVGLFYIFYNYLFRAQIFTIGIFVFEPHTIAFACSFFIAFPIAFWLSKYVVWTESNLKGHIQLFRYFLIVVIDFLINYFFLKLFIEYFHMHPFLAKILTTALAIIFSYLSQKYFTFKVKALPQ